MIRLLPAAGAVLALTLGAAHVEAQDATPTHVVMRYFKCSPQAAGVEQLQRGRHIAQSMVEEGKFLSYNILGHNWGDEWNVIDVFTVDGIDSFFANFAELTQRTNEELGEDDGEFARICTEHKDNIYAVVGPPEG